MYSRKIPKSAFEITAINKKGQANFEHKAFEQDFASNHIEEGLKNNLFLKRIKQG